MVGIVVVTINDIGKQLVIAAEEIVGKLKHITAVSVGVAEEPKEYEKKISEAFDNVNRGHGVIVLIDLCGFVHSNVVKEMMAGKEGLIISGVNLPMLLKAAKSQSLNLIEAGKMIETAGHKYIVSIPTKNCTCSTKLIAPTAG